MTSTDERIVNAVRILRNAGIEPILYGSAGAYLYLGAFKKIGDIDLLIDGHWLHDDWKRFISILGRHGFRLFDEKEHEFVNGRGEKLSFAEKEILTKDKICSLPSDLVRKQVGTLEVTTLPAHAFRNAYLFSSKDGYRQSQRTMKDSAVIALFDQLEER